MALDSRVSVPCSRFGQSDATMLCFSQADGKGTCGGDSGGPSFATINGVERVVAVTSFGDVDCARLNAGTRVDAELAFLFEHVLELACQEDGACNDECGDNELPEDPDCPVDENCAADGVCNPACGENELPEDEDCATCEETNSCDTDDRADNSSPTQPKPDIDDCLDSEDCASAPTSASCSTTSNNGLLSVVWLSLVLLGFRRQADSRTMSQDL